MAWAARRVGDVETRRPGHDLRWRRGEEDWKSHIDAPTRWSREEGDTFHKTLSAAGTWGTSMAYFSLTSLAPSRISRPKHPTHKLPEVRRLESHPQSGLLPRATRQALLARILSQTNPRRSCRSLFFSEVSELSPD